MTASAKEIANLVERALSAPIMGFAGGSTADGQSVDRWKRDLTEQLSTFRGTYQPPEVHTILDAVEKLLR